MFEKQNIQETISKLNSDTVKGLTEGEAFRRLRQNGRNEMRAARKKTKIQLFLEQLKDPLIYILLIAAVVSILLGEVSDALIIGTVVLVNALVGMLQEGKARKALEALRKLTTPRTIVIRDGIRREIPAAELVTGDLVELEAGARVPADIRLTRSANLQVEESALTGESVPVEKDALFLADCRQEIPLTERVNMVYMSTVVTNGHGEGLVVATGGGALTFQRNVDAFKEGGVIVLLDTPLRVLQLRLKNDRNRPLLQRPDRFRFIRELHQKRMPLYRRAADVVIPTKGSPNAVCRQVLQALEEKNLTNS